MCIKKHPLWAVLTLVSASGPTFAEGAQVGNSEIYRAGELDLGYSHIANKGTITWALDSWLGNDEHRLVIRSDGDYTYDQENAADVQLLYGKMQSEFWNSHLGIKQRIKPDSTTWLVLGVEGVARYILATEAHLFVSDQGDISASLTQETELLLGQHWSLIPGYAIEAYWQDVEEEVAAAGLSHLGLSLTTQYEINPKISPYFMLEYTSAMFGTRGLLADADEETSAWLWQAGVGFTF